jgi:hypothetical protein
MYTGELNVLSGRRALVSIRAAEAGELIEIEREALRTLVQTDSQLSDIFLRAAGGQAGQFKDRKLSGFRTGISGQELAGNAYTQAQKFGAQLLIARHAKGLACDRRPYALKLDAEEKIPALQHRRIDLPITYEFAINSLPLRLQVIP